ncbi:MAG: LysE family transporter [Kiloniellales bacterium]|nr:LysE family transporter [Kiloniellales bacterium]
MLGISLLAKGLAVGLAVAAPVGPIGLLCIRKTLASGRLAGLATGLGAATGDAVYGLIAASGFALSALLLSHGELLRTGGGLLLVALGCSTLWKGLSPGGEPTSSHPKRLDALGAFASTFALTLANPMTIITFIAMIAALGITDETVAMGPFLLVLGVFLGSALWWLCLVQATLFFRLRMTPSVKRTIDFLSAMFLTGWGLVILWGAA